MRARLKRWIAIARRSLSLGFVVAVVASGTLLYGRNASQLPAHLVIDPALQSKLNLLAGGLHTEVVLCLQGTVEGDTAWASSFSMPEQYLLARSHEEAGHADVAKELYGEIANYNFNSVGFALVRQEATEKSR